MTKKLIRVLQGEALWPPPIWLMRQAGRYLPEYRALRASTGDFITCCTTPEVAAEITLQPIRRFGMDAAILFSDILILPWAMGYGLRFEAGEGPVLPQLQGPADIEALDLERLRGAIEPVLETVRLVRQGLDQQTLIGFAGAPFTVATYMVEGGGSKDHARTRAMAHAEPRMFSRLIDRLTEATIVYLSAQIEAGAEAVMLFDTWAGVLSPYLFREYAIAPAKHIVSALKARFPAIPVVGFPRMAGLMLDEYARSTGVDGVGMDTGVDPVLAAAKITPEVALQGNLDPLALLAGGEAMRRDTKAILAALRGRRHVFNLGHGVVPPTPVEHVAELVALVQGA
jgi:uroporphyrinogen decarboxylase